MVRLNKWVNRQVLNVWLCHLVHRVPHVNCPELQQLTMPLQPRCQISRPVVSPMSQIIWPCVLDCACACAGPQSHQVHGVWPASGAAPWLGSTHEAKLVYWTHLRTDAVWHPILDQFSPVPLIQPAEPERLSSTGLKYSPHRLHNRNEIFGCLNYALSYFNTVKKDSICVCAFPLPAVSLFNF